MNMSVVLGDLLTEGWKLHVFMLFFFNDTATTEIYTLSLHDALPIFSLRDRVESGETFLPMEGDSTATIDRKSTRLNSSHMSISYAVFCLKKKTTKITASSRRTPRRPRRRRMGGHRR